MKITDRLCIEQFHAARIKQYGANTARGLAWKDSENQFKMFETLCKVGDLNNTTVLDVGCGNGDLCFYLSQHFSGFTYYGIDFIPTFLDNALELNKECTKATFFLGDFTAVKLPMADYVMACGSLNYKNSEPDFIYKVITQLFRSCTIAFAFNLLSKTINPDGILQVYEPKVILEFCYTLSEKVILIENSKEEFTVMVYSRIG